MGLRPCAVCLGRCERKQEKLFLPKMQQRYDVLDKLQIQHKLTPEGADWVKLALDPFHDFNHQVAGYPDADASQTVVSCYQYQADITAPPGVAGNWDCHIHNLPIATSSSYVNVTEDPTWSNFTQYNPNVVCGQGPLTILSGAAGANLLPQGAVVATNASQTLPAYGNTDISSGISRVIGMGFEVTNTTAEINKQGSVTTYRMPQCYGESSTVTRNAALTFVAQYNARRYRQPPTTLAQVNLLKGTRTWDAASGVYVTCAQNSISNPLCQVSNEGVIFSPSASPGTVQSVLTAPYTAIPTVAAAAPNAAPIAPDPSQFLPFDTSGAYFTGLSNTTILTVKFKVYVERAPTFFEASLAVLATPSAGYDVNAFALYAHAISELPVATKVFNNASGDWWRSVLGVLGKVSGGVGVALNGVLPGAGIFGTAIQAAAAVASASIAKKKQKQNPPKETKPKISDQQLVTMMKDRHLSLKNPSVVSGTKKSKV